jgi:hypothetical protein
MLGEWGEQPYRLDLLRLPPRHSALVVDHVLSVEEVVIEDVGPHVIEALHVLPIFVSQVEPDRLVKAETLGDLLNRITLQVEEDAEGVHHSALARHLAQGSTHLRPIGWEFEGRNEHPGAALSASLYQLDLLRRRCKMLGRLLIDLHLVFNEHPLVPSLRIK